MPFENSVDTWEMKGEHIKEMFEHSFSKPSFRGRRLLHVSGQFLMFEFDHYYWRYLKFTQHLNLSSLIGARVVYNVSQPIGERVMSVEISESESIEPQYKPIDMNRYYKCTGMEYLSSGGDGFAMIPKYRKNYRWVVSPLVVCVCLSFIVWYTSKQIPLFFLLLWQCNRRGSIDIDVIIEYLAAKQVIDTGIEGRITIDGRKNADNRARA